MITVVLTEHADVQWRKVLSNGSIPVFGTEPTDLTPQFLIAPSEPPPSRTLQEEIGYLFKGKEAVGRMRDRDVRHLSAQGSISVLSSSMVTGHTSSGVPRMTTTGGVTYNIHDVVYWGFPCPEVTHSLPEYRYYNTYDAKWHIQDVRNGRWFFQFSGDKGILVAEIERGANWYETPRNVANPYAKLGYITKLRRSGTLIYTMGSISKTSGYYTASEREATLNGIAATGGSAITGNYYTHSSLGDDQVILDSVIDAVKNQIGSIGPVLGTHPTDFGQLALECAAQLRFVDQSLVTMIFDVEDWTNFRALWKSFANTDGWKQAIAAFKRIAKSSSNRNDLIRTLKPLSATYLFGKYAVLPNVGDIKRLLGGVKEASSLYRKQQRLHSRRITSIDAPNSSSGATHTAVLTVQCHEYPLNYFGQMQRLIGDLKNWGMYPEPANLWDMIPYSFVVDWFVQFGDTLEDIDNYWDVEYYFPATYCVSSEKWSVQYPISTLVPGFAAWATGVVDLTYYIRWISRELPVPTVSFTMESALGKHSVESTALILQRIKV